MIKKWAPRSLEAASVHFIPDGNTPHVILSHTP
jgi:hypothetical protein